MVTASNTTSNRRLVQWPWATLDGETFIKMPASPLTTSHTETEPISCHSGATHALEPSEVLPSELTLLWDTGSRGERTETKGDLWWEHASYPGWESRKAQTFNLREVFGCWEFQRKPSPQLRPRRRALGCCEEMHV